MDNERAIWAEAGIGETYQRLDLLQYTGDPQAKIEVQKYIKNLDAMKHEGLGLLHWGPNGRGKTMLAAEVLKAASLQMNPRTRRNYTVCMTSLSEIVSMFTEGWSSSTAKAEFRTRILQRDFLLIDDAEKVYMPQKENNIVITVTDEVLRKRVNNLRPVFITTNQTPKELGAIFGESIGSLLAGCVIPIKFNGQDHRKVNNAVEKFKKFFPATTAGMD